MDETAQQLVPQLWSEGFGPEDCIRKQDRIRNTGIGKNEGRGLEVGLGEVSAATP